MRHGPRKATIIGSFPRRGPGYDRREERSCATTPGPPHPPDVRRFTPPPRSSTDLAWWPADDRDRVAHNDETLLRRHAALVLLRSVRPPFWEALRNGSGRPARLPRVPGTPLPLAVRQRREISGPPSTPGESPEHDGVGSPATSQTAVDKAHAAGRNSGLTALRFPST